MIHLTVGVYKNGDYKTNGVDTKDLENHIEYNKTLRFGRALFVDGECVNAGYLNVEEVAEWTAKIKEFPIPKQCTAPYH